jgi:UDP-N-acetylmuramoyl-L-alanyl-D-glutamate--2,6-diaminopimelate ligase
MKMLHSAQETFAWLTELKATGLTTDSRNIQTGNVFVAWPGAAVDGRAYAADAITKGAKAALMEFEGSSAFENSIALEGAAALLGLKAASGEIASLFYGQPSHHMNVIAFTGTNGKTSSSWWLAQALDGAVVGTLGIGKIGSVVSNGLTTPDPVLLQAKLKALLDAGCRVIALEASSIGIAEGRLNGTQIHTAVFTNFTQDHLDYHGSMESYWQAKAALFDWPHLKAAVVNIDDPQGLVLLDRLHDSLSGRTLDVWTVAIDKPARLQAVNIRTTPAGLAFDVLEGGESHPLQTTLVGRYNVSNLLGVIASMRSLEMPLAACLLACGQITPVPGRLEVVSTSNQPLVVVDYAHTPDALEKALLAMREVTDARGGKLWCIFGCGGDRDASKRPVMGATARANADYVVVTSDNPRSEAPALIVSQILLGAGDDTSVQVQVDRALAISETIAQAATNDVIVIAGKGHENYQEIAGVKHPFSDQAHARAALNAWRAAA